MDQRPVSRGIAGQSRRSLFFHRWLPPQPKSVSAARSESSLGFSPGAQQISPIGRRRCLPLDPHLAAVEGLKLDDAHLRRCRSRRNQFDECRLAFLAPNDGDSPQPLLQPHVVKPQWMRDRIYAVLPGQFDRGLPQRLRQLCPSRLGAAKLIQLKLQLYGAPQGSVV